MPNIFFQNYFNRGFWGDEAWTALISKFSLPEIIHVTSQDFHPPFYYFLVHIWGNLFSFSETNIRLLSFIFLLLTIVITYKLAKKLLKEQLTRIAATILIATSPILFTYAFEARAYALLSLLSVSSTFIFLQTLQSQKRYKWQILYFLLGAIAVYTHYYAWFILASHGIYLLLFNRKKIRYLIIPALGILLAQLPWLPNLFSQINQVGKSYWIAPINEKTHWEFFYRTISGDTHTRFQVPLAIAVSSVIAFSFLKLIYQTIKSGFSYILTEEKSTIFLFTWLIIPTLIPTIISLKLPIFFYRYLIFSAIPIIFLTLKTLENLPRFILYSSILIIFSIYLYTDYKIFSHHPNTFKQEKIKLEEQQDFQNSNSIYTVLPSFAEVMYYFDDSHHIRVLPQGLVQFSGKSLLDAFVTKGEVEITQPLSDSYYLLKPGPTSFHISPQNPSPEPLF